MKENMLEKVLRISIAFSKERDRKRLLEQLLSALMDITNCESGAVYIKNEKSMECGEAQSSNHSKLEIPLEDDRENILGMVRLMNARDEAGKPSDFPAEQEAVCVSLASQAAICLANINYAQQIREMLDSYVKVMSTAIDARTPYNANHTKNMVNYAKRFIAWLKENHGMWGFDEQKIQAFLMCVWLHDIGKLVTPLEIMDKQDRLAHNYVKVMDRFEKIRLLTHIAYLEGKLSSDDAKQRMGQIADAKELVEQVNTIGYLTEELAAKVEVLATYTYEEEGGSRVSWITAEEKEQLLIRKGTLTQTERRVMQEHVEMTRVMLEQMTFGDDYKEVLIWAPQHHELLNGTGYPLGRKGEEICFEVRLLTILDMFEAMTALDRPYKQPVRVEHALQILHEMADEGAIDADILNLFEQSRAWEEPMATE